MSNTMVTGNWSDFVNGVSARVNEIIDETKDLTPSFLQSGLFTVVSNPDSKIYRTEGVTGLDYLKKFDENDTIPSDTTFPAYKTEYAMNQYGKIISVSQMLMKTRPSELEAKLDEVRQARIAANRTLNKHAWQILVDGFSTSDSNANYPIARLSDGVAMYNTAHPSRVTGVSDRSNQLAGNPVYSETNQFTAIKTVKEQLNGRGLPIGFEGKFVLVIPPALEKQAVEVNKSIKRSGTGDNDVNYFEGIVDIISTPYIGAANGGSDTAWYMFAKSDMQKSLVYVSLIDPKIETDVDFFTKSMNISIDASYALGYSNWEFTCASDGSGS